MQDGETITINSKRKLVTIYISRILYVIMQRQYAEIHVYGNRKYVTRMTFGELKKQLGENFIEVRRGCIVSIKAIRSITDKVNLINGGILRYTVRRKKEILSNYQAIIDGNS